MSGIEGSTERPTSRSERLRSEYALAVSRYLALRASVPEALMYEEKPATTPEARAVAALDLERDGVHGVAEAFAQQNKEGAERAARMIEQMLDAKLTLLRLYCDAHRESEELAALIREEHPFVQAMLDSANDESYGVARQEVA